MARLPQVGGDDDSWGNVLNDFLQVAHNADGTLQGSAISQAGGILSSQVSAVNGVAGLNGSGLVPAAQLGGGTASTSNFLRGDGTWAVPAGGGNTLASDTDVAIVSPSNNQVLTYSSGSNKWINQAPAAAPVSSVFTRTGVVTAQNGDYTAAQITNAADKSSGAAQTFTANLGTPAIAITGLTGATAASRYVGATVSGAPVSGTFLLGDYIVDQTGKIWVCITAGSPGTWTKATIAIDSTASDIQPLGSQAAGSTGKAADAGHVHPTTGLALLSGASFTGGVNPSVIALTYGSTISVNAASGNDFRITLTGSGATIATPTSPTDGQRITFHLTQDSTGSRTVTWQGGGYNFGTSGIPTLSTAANLTDVIGFIYNATIGQWLAAGAALGF